MLNFKIEKNIFNVELEGLYKYSDSKYCLSREFANSIKDSYGHDYYVVSYYNNNKLEGFLIQY